MVFGLLGFAVLLFIESFPVLPSAPPVVPYQFIQVVTDLLLKAVLPLVTLVVGYYFGTRGSRLDSEPD